MEYTTAGYEDMELSTQLIIKEAQARGHKVRVLDRKNQVISIQGPQTMEYIQQATRTSADSYISPLLMDNKLVTKKLLQEAGIPVPLGDHYDTPEQALKAFPYWENLPLVIKPNQTNYGIAVHSFPQGASLEDYTQAVEDSFKWDKLILIEEYLPWPEYRFLVIGDKVAAVLHRVPANVIGDGRSSIESLVKKKNRNPLRQKGYVSPLEKIRLEETEELYLKEQNLSFSSIPKKGEQIFLRKNSNISTGGDSIDLSDDVHRDFKELAVAAAGVLGAKICGVDLMAKDIENRPQEGGFGIIELNFNPALHIHDFPFQGKNRKVEAQVLNLLNL